MIRLKRVYREPNLRDGMRILLDRVWPRGIGKERARIVEWRKDVAPSTALRRWFGHEPARRTEFRRRYRTELTRSEMIGELRKLARLSRKKTITLVYGAADEEHNQAVALKEWLDELSRGAHGSHDVTVRTAECVYASTHSDTSSLWVLIRERGREHGVQSDSFSLKKGAHMTNEEKRTRIRQWINPEERVTVHFLDAPDLNTTVTGCTDQLVDLSIETHVPFMAQRISVPLSHVEVSEDLSHYTRDPERPLQRQRLMLVIDENRPPIIY